LRTMPTYYAGVSYWKYKIEGPVLWTITEQLYFISSRLNCIWDIPVQVLAWLAGILTEVFCGFTQSLQVNGGTIPWNRL
jgi:hypothetical protein